MSLGAEPEKGPNVTQVMFYSFNLFSLSYFDSFSSCSRAFCIFIKVILFFVHSTSTHPRRNCSWGIAHYF